VRSGGDPERPRFLIRASGSLLDTAEQNDDSGIPLASTPANSFHLEARLRNPRWPVEIGARGGFATARLDVPALVEPAEDWRSLDLFLRFTPKTGPLAGADWTLSANNLTDEYFTIYPAVVPQPGRSLRLAVAYRFGR